MTASSIDRGLDSGMATQRGHATVKVAMAEVHARERQAGTGPFRSAHAREEKKTSRRTRYLWVWLPRLRSLCNSVRGCARRT